jgi:hypothetical protein
MVGNSETTRGSGNLSSGPGKQRNRQLTVLRGPFRFPNEPGPEQFAAKLCQNLTEHEVNYELPIVGSTSDAAIFSIDAVS